jgi:hypothetical protein
MKSFDSIIQENILTKAWNAAGTGISSVKNIASIAKTAATNPSLKPFTDLFSKIKTKLELVNSNTALKSVGFLRSELIPWRYKTNSVIIDSEGQLSGIVGEVINYKKDQRFKNFLQYLETNKDTIQYNFKNIVKETETNNRFWVVISPKGNETVENIQQEPSPEQTQPQQTQQQTQQPNPPTTQRTQSDFGGYGESYDQKIQKYYSILSENVIEEAKTPQNNTEYSTHFIYKTSPLKQQNIGKIIILPKGQTPPKEYGETIPLKDMGAEGLVLCGNKTLYPRWYFLNDFEKMEKEQTDKDKDNPKQSNLITRNYNTIV